MGSFEKFIHKRMQAPGKAMVTITKTGVINFNLATMQKYIKENQYAILYFDAEDKLVGILPTNKKTPEGYSIRKYRHDKFGTMSGTAFLKYYGIPYNETQSYSVAWNEQKEMIIIDLKEHWDFSKPEPEDEEVPF